jgi:glucose-6-phosphate isomerase
VQISFFHDTVSTVTGNHFKRFAEEGLLERLRALDARWREGGLDGLDAADPVVAIGTEVDGSGKVTKNSYGVLNLAWQAAEHPEWAGVVLDEVAAIRKRIRHTHGTRLRFLIWAGMGGSVEDKSMYNALGLLRKAPRCYALDSTDPAKLKAILDDMTSRSGESMAALLRSTLVVGMAMGMTSYEPVVNLQKLAALYEKHKIDSRPNFIYLTLPGSLLDQFAAGRGYRKVELQLDNGNTTAGRHSAPLTRGSLYPLALCGADLEKWMEGTNLSDEEIALAWELSAFLHAHGESGRDKVTLMLPKPWAGAGLWTKQDFEESLGKREALGIKVLIGERIRLADYRSPKDPRQDRVFLAVQVKGASKDLSQKIQLVRRAGYPLAVLTLPAATPLSSYLQFVHYVVCGLGFLRGMNFVTQPGVELYKAIASRVYAEAGKSGGVVQTRAWKTMTQSPRKATWRGLVTLYYDGLKADACPESDDAPRIYSSLLKELAADRRVDYAELTYFGDTRYSRRGRAIRKSLDRAAERFFRARLKMPVDAYEGPAMNHSYHEMVIGRGRCFSTVLFSEKQDELAAANYTAEYHRAQFLATKLALEERGRPVVALILKDLGEKSLAALDEFFRQAAVK